MMRATNIKWNVDDENDLERIPDELEIPEGITDEDEISDWISDTTGFLHDGFCLESN